MNKKYFLDLEIPELQQQISDLGLKPFRIKQIIKWVYQKRADSFLNCSDLPQDLREKLNSLYFLRQLKLKQKIVSDIDGTTKYNFLTEDNLTITTVFLPQKNRTAVCLSTQIGCLVGCKFCASGKKGFKRNLTKGEIIEQIFQVEKDSCIQPDSILFMGMGEPLLNYENLISALKTIVDTEQLGFGRRHITVSTIGIVPNIKKLAEEKFGVRLAISLHSTNDDLRKTIVSENIKYSVKEILTTGFEYASKTNSRLTIEYVLLKGFNDSFSQAKDFVKTIKRLNRTNESLQINLIPYNVINDKNFQSPEPPIVHKFKDYLMNNGLLTIIRSSKGADIGAGCGQIGCN